MPIALDVATNGGNSGAATVNSFSWNHTCTGSNLILIVAIADGTGTTTGVTYNNVSLTKINGTGYGTSLWYLINPATGTHSVVVSRTNNQASSLGGVSASYSGVNQSSPIDSSNAITGTYGSTDPLTVSTTVVKPNCWLVGTAIYFFGTSTRTLSSNRTSRGSWSNIVAGGGTAMIMSDSNGTISTGSQGTVFTPSGTPNYGFSGVVASIAPLPDAPTVTTQSATNVAQTSCTGNGNITATGGENCTRRGFCYKVGTSGDPTTSDSVAYDDGSFGTGAFTKSITGLTPNTSYRVRAYAVNSAGTSYGTTVQVTTLKAFKPRTMWF